MTLGLAWLFVFFSIIINWEIPASGAVLVCSALIAEIYYEQLRWRRLPCEPSGIFPLVKDNSSEFPILWGNFAIAQTKGGTLGALLSLAKDDDIKKRSDDSDPYWHYRNTVDVVEKLVLHCIVATALTGTALWGYGHLLTW